MPSFRISRPSHPITWAEWKTLVATHPNLKPHPPYWGINPFTKEKVHFKGTSKALCTQNNQPAGEACYEDLGDGEGDILTTDIPPDICQDIAASLNAQVFDDDRG